MKTIQDVEVQVSEKICGVLKELSLIPEGYVCRARLHGVERDKRRTAIFEKNWSPDTDSIHISFEALSTEDLAASKRAAPAVVTTPVAPAATPVRAANANPLADMIRALDRAESRPGYDFVALKWFRDTALPLEHFSWASDEFARQSVLREAIDKRLILTSKIANPKSPQFPVTAIRLNRLMPEVMATLGNEDRKVSSFQPIAIRGEGLSTTILHDRR